MELNRIPTLGGRAMNFRIWNHDRYKVFVGGISRETTEDALKEHFSKYGAVSGAAIAREKNTGNPRCFGFVCFANDVDVDKALQDNHVILGRAVDVKKAIPRNEQAYNNIQSHLQRYESTLQHNSTIHEVPSNSDNRNKKVFVGGLSSNTSEEEFKNYFERFGRTTDVVVMHDSATNRPRGFGFVTFDSEDSVNDVMQSNFHELNNRRVEVKRAIPKQGIQNNNGNHNPSTYNNFQPRPYAPNRNGYGMYMPYPPVFGFQTAPTFHYPADMNGYGYPFTPQAPNFPWNNPMMPGTGFYYPPTIDTPNYFPYMNGFDLSGTSFPGYNPVMWPLADTAAGPGPATGPAIGPVSATGPGSAIGAGPATGGAGVGGLIPRFEGLTIEVPSQGHNRMNGGGFNNARQRGNASYR